MPWSGGHASPLSKIHCLVFPLLTRSWRLQTRAAPRMSAMVWSGTALPSSRNWRRWRAKSSVSGSTHAAAPQRNPAARNGASRFLRGPS